MTSCKQGEILINDTCLIDNCNTNCSNHGSCVQSAENPDFATCKCDPAYDPRIFCSDCVPEPHSQTVDGLCVPSFCGDINCGNYGECKFREGKNEFHCQCSSGFDERLFCSQCKAGSVQIGEECEVEVEKMATGAQIAICVVVVGLCGGFLTAGFLLVRKIKMAQKSEDLKVVVAEGSEESQILGGEEKDGEGEKSHESSK